jgi:signal transduction histidine kinase
MPPTPAFRPALAPVAAPGSRCPALRTDVVGRAPTCIYLDVMQAQRLGVVVFDLARERLVLVNRFAEALFARVQQPIEFAALRDLLGVGAPPGASATSEPAAQTVQIGKRLLGFTLYGAGAHRWAYVRDITDKARLESIAEAVETTNNIGYVFSAVRHELGNPINSVRAALSVLRANLDKFPPERVAEYVDRITAEVGRVEHLLRSLRSFSLYEEPTLAPLDVSAFSRDFLRLIPTQAGAQDVAVEATIEDGCWATADFRALQQILLNLLANACDAMRGRPDPTLRLSVCAADGLVTVRLTDNGDGMDPEELSQVFKPFFTTKEKGTGLGLVISRKLATKMGGTITIESTPGRGTSALLTLQHRPHAP